MITIISGTNRPDSKTQFIAESIFELIGKFTDESVNLIKLSEVDPTFIHPMMYDPGFQHPEVTKLQDEQLIPSEKWIFISPEYNGSYSGIGKVFIDALSIRLKTETFSNKKLALIGVAVGRAGNLRGLDHLTTALNYMGMLVFPNRLPLSQVHTMITDDKLTVDAVKLLDGYLEGFVNF